MIICYTDAKDELSEVVSLYSEYGVFYIGDINLLLSQFSKDYWEFACDHSIGLYNIDGCEFFINNTENNNCVFVDTDDFEYVIKSGSIGIVPYELCDTENTPYYNTCRKIESKSINVQTLSDKAIYVVYNNGKFTIPTSFEDVLVIDENYVECNEDNDEDFDCIEMVDTNEDFDCIELVNNGSDNFDCLDVFSMKL